MSCPHGQFLTCAECQLQNLEEDMQVLRRELAAARAVIDAALELRNESPRFYGNLKKALEAYDKVRGRGQADG